LNLINWKAASIFGAAFFFSISIFPFENNIVLISIDTLRPDYLGFNSNKAPSPSPFLDFLSKKCIIFSKAITPIPLTFPSHSSILTALYPYKHKIRDNGRGILSKEILTIQKFLKKKNYQTFAVIGSYVLSSRFGLAEGFDIYDDFVYKDGTEKVTFAFQERDARTVLENVIKIYEKIDKSKPYFFFIHFYDCHSPYKNHNISRSFNNYEEEIAYVDLNIRKLFEKLDDGNTLWIFLSDHGEAFGEHKEYTHGFLTYDTTLKVLFMLYFPKSFQAKIINERVSTLDLFPTIADLFSEKIECDGISLLPFILKNQKIPKRDFLFESFYAKINFTKYPIYGAFIGDFKVILPEPYEVYDLKKDEKEVNNLAKEKKDYISLAKRMTVKILEDEEIGELKEEDAKALRALGYLSSKKPVEGERVSPKEVFFHYSEISKYRDNFLLNKKEFPFKEYEEFLKKFPKAAFLSLELGMGYMREKKYKEAIYWLENSIKYDPEMIEAWLDLGNLYYLENEIEKAEKAYLFANKLDKDFPYPYLTLGKIYYDKGDLKKAEEYWKKFVELAPKDENVPKIKKLLNIGG